jgi:hypothetical protein
MEFEDIVVGEIYHITFIDPAYDKPIDFNGLVEKFINSCPKKGNYRVTRKQKLNYLDPNDYSHIQLDIIEYESLVPDKYKKTFQTVNNTLYFYENDSFDKIEYIDSYDEELKETDSIFPKSKWSYIFLYCIIKTK